MSAVKKDIKLTYTHEAMVDFILQEPSVRIGELAEVFDRSVGWVSRVLASDSFKARMAQRRKELIDPIVAQSVNERLGAVVIQATTLLNEKLDLEESGSLAMDALAVASKMMGSGRG